MNNTFGTTTNTLNFTGGTLIANSIALPLTNNGGTLVPDFADFTGLPTDINSIPITQVSTLTFAGTNGYIQGPTGALEIDIVAAGTNDFVNIGADASVASASLSGTVRVNLLNNFDPALGSTFDILSADSITNTVLVIGITHPLRRELPVPEVRCDTRQ